MAFISAIDGTPSNGSNPWLDSLVWGGAWSSGNKPEVTITYTFKMGVNPEPGGTVGKSWTSAEMAAMRAAMKSWEAVANVDFVEKSSGADMWLWLFDNTALPDFAGYAEVPDPQGDVVEPLYLGMNTDDTAWKTSGSLKNGGWSYATMIHELGHSLGLAHPHDGGLQTSGNRFPGVTAETNDFGDHSLNQSIYTIMSYNDGWPSKFPAHTSLVYGSAASPMALDIAAIQSIYGANMSYRTGSDTYVLPSANNSGTGWICIWDAGGTDSISANGVSRDVSINLNPATGQGAGGGGYVSYAQGIVGGFTIAKGVVIEKATGGLANDKIIGNSISNQLSGSLGNDKIFARGGDDRLFGGAGTDLLNGGAGTDTVSYSKATKAINASLTRQTLLKHAEQGADNYISIENLIGGSGNDRLEGNASANLLNGRKGADRLIGSAGNDIISGGAGDDSVNGGSGADRLTGDSGRDIFVFDAPLGEQDTIVSFVSADDTLHLDLDAFTQLQQTGVLNASTFVLGTVSTDVDDRIIFDPNTGAMFYDSDGIGMETAIQFLTIESNTGTLTADDLIVV